MANAFAYGAKKYGDGTWRSVPAAEHLNMAMSDIIDWKAGIQGKPLLIDAALHVVFAVSIAISRSSSPSEYQKK